MYQEVMNGGGGQFKNLKIIENIQVNKTSPTSTTTKILGPFPDYIYANNIPLDKTYDHAMVEIEGKFNGNRYLNLCAMGELTKNNLLITCVNWKNDNPITDIVATAYLYDD